MQPEHQRRIIQRQGLDHVRVGLDAAPLGDDIIKAVSREEERLVAVEDMGAAKLVQVGGQDPPVERVGDAPAVHGLADQVAQRLPRELLVPVRVGLSKVHREQPPRDQEVRVVEVVGDVPAETAVLSALLHHRVEEGQHVHEGAVGPVRTLLQVRLLQLAIAGFHVELQAVRWLRHNLERALQDAQGEVRGGLSETKAVKDNKKKREK